MSLTEKRKLYLRIKYRRNIRRERKRIARNKRLHRLKNIELARSIERAKAIKYRERRLTYGKVKWAVISGKIKKPKLCQKCGKRKRLQGHHKDYSKPLDVMWLCIDCHMEQHFAPTLQAKIK